MGKAVRLKIKIADLQQQIIYLNRKLEKYKQSVDDAKFAFDVLDKQNGKLMEEIANLEDKISDVEEAHSDQKAM